MPNNAEIVLRELAPKILIPSVRNALNRAATSSRKFVAEEIKERLDLTSKDTKQIEIQRAQAKPLDGRFIAKLRMVRLKVPLIKFGAKRVRVSTTRGVRYGVMVKNQKARSQYSLFVKGGFIAKMPTGHRGVFRRKGGERLPIRELFYSPGESVFKDKAFNERVTKHAAVTFEKNLKSEIAFRESRVGK